MPATPKVIKAGASKPNPFTIAIIANPAIEAPWNSGTFVPDPIIGGPQAAFDASVTYIDTVLFGGLPAQAEQLLGDPAIGPLVRVVSVFDAALPPSPQNSLVGQDAISNLLIARRTAFKPFLASYGIAADV